MFNFRVLSILKRELKARIATKSFIISTLVMPLIFIVMIAIQIVISEYSGDSKATVRIVTENQEVTDRLRAGFAEKEYVKDSTYTMEYSTISNGEFDKQLPKLKDRIVDEKLDVVVFISDSAVASKNLELYSRNTKNISLERRLGRVINTVLIDLHFQGKDISPDDLNYARHNVDFNSLKVTKDKAIEENNEGQLALAYIFNFLLYISLLMMASLTLQSVIEEKANRIVEVILSSVNSTELMVGKIVGASLTGLLQMAIWLSPIIIIIFFSLPVLPADIVVTLDWSQIAYFMFNFLIGLLIFTAMAGSVGSMYDNPQDAQQAFGPIVMIIVVPFLISMVILQNPTNPIGVIASMLPITNIIVLPVRMTMVDVPIWNYLVAVAVNFVTLYGIYVLAGKIYRIGLLQVGKKPKIKDIIKWLKTN